MLIRLLDILFSMVGIILLTPVFIIVYIIGLFVIKKPLFFQKRLGLNRAEFTLVKFRTMPIDTKSVASHLVVTTEVSRFGLLLRKSKLDEIPQLINVLLGHMSLVGPRPNLSNQHDLIVERSKLDVYCIKPGITGLAQINNIDMSTPRLLAETDSKMISTFSITNYFYYIFKTISGKGSGDAFSRDNLK